MRFGGWVYLDRHLEFTLAASLWVEAFIRMQELEPHKGIFSFVLVHLDLMGSESRVQGTGQGFRVRVGVYYQAAFLQLCIIRNVNTAQG